MQPDSSRGCRLRLVLEPASRIQMRAVPSSLPLLHSVLRSGASRPGRGLCSGNSRSLVSVCLFFLPLAVVVGCYVMHLCRCLLMADRTRVPCRGTFYVQYQEMEVLGEGAFGKALKCRRRRDNQMFVVKIMHESKMSEKAREEVSWCQSLPDGVAASAGGVCTLQL